MARIIEIVSTTSDIHYLLIGLNNDELSSFAMQLWITRYGRRMVDWVQSLGLNFCTFIGGDLWIHNDDDQDRCNLFGEKRDCIVEVVANENPLRVKVLDSIGVHSDSTWEVTSVTIPPTLNYPNGMQSKIPTAQFKKRDGVWQARFLRNMKSTSDTVSVREALNGEPLRGNEALLTLKNTSNEQVKLFRVSVNMTTSRI